MHGWSLYMETYKYTLVIKCLGRAAARARAFQEPQAVAPLEKAYRSCMKTPTAARHSIRRLSLVHAGFLVRGCRRRNRLGFVGSHLSGGRDSQLQHDVEFKKIPLLFVSLRKGILWRQVTFVSSTSWSTSESHMWWLRLVGSLKV